MEHKWMRLFKNGVWHGSADRTITVKGVEHNLDEYAKEHGIDLPDAKSNKKSKKEVNSYADMEQPHDSGHTEEHGDGDSEGTE